MSWFFPQGKGRGVFRGWAEGWLRWFAHPFGGVECRHAQPPAFAPSAVFLLPALQKWQLGFWSFCILLIICGNSIDRQLFLVLYSFFIFCC